MKKAMWIGLAVLAVGVVAYVVCTGCCLPGGCGEVCPPGCCKMS